eukprot:363185-Chlamydomonas_euryale.AAC.15
MRAGLTNPFSCITGSSTLGRVRMLAAIMPDFLSRSPKKLPAIVLQNHGFESERRASVSYVPHHRGCHVT